LSAAWTSLAPTAPMASIRKKLESVLKALRGATLSCPRSSAWSVDLLPWASYQRTELGDLVPVFGPPLRGEWHGKAARSGLSTPEASTHRPGQPTPIGRQSLPYAQPPPRTPRRRSCRVNPIMTARHVREFLIEEKGLP
jgi:hypothetical protein